MRPAGEMVRHKGGCHCGAVSFEVEAPRNVIVEDCNCSICAKAGFLHLIVPKSRFHLTSGEDNLTEYNFNEGIARHLFCKTCGVKSFYVPRSNPDGFSVNYRCLDPSGFENVEIHTFDGQNWEDNAAVLRDLSRD